MNSALIDSLSPAKLSQLLKLDEPRWDDQDAAGILRHQLQASVLGDLIQIPSLVQEISWLQERMAQKGKAADATFLMELTAPVPPLELLVAIKRFARQVQDDAGHPMHGKPATILYFAALAAALARCGTRISQLSDVELNEGFGWAIKQGGAEKLTGIFQEALVQLHPPGDSAHAGHRP